MNETINPQKATQQKTATTRIGLKKLMIIFFSLILIVIIAGFTYGYLQLAKVNLYLAKTVTTLQQRAGETNTVVNTLQANVTHLQTSLDKAQTLTDEQSQLINSWHQLEQGDLTRWRVAEAAYLTQLANQHLQFTYDAALATATLQNASQLLSNINDDKIAVIKQALTTQIATLQNASTIDEKDIYHQLTALDDTLQQLPLPVTPLTDNDHQTLNNPNQPAENKMDLNTPWWQRGLSNSWAALSKIVIVRRNKTNALPLVLPEQKTLLYFNLHMEMQAAIWGLLQHQETVYQTSLTRVTNWVSTYFLQEAAPTQNALQTLANLQKINLAQPTVNLNDVITLFDAYLATKP